MSSCLVDLNVWIALSYTRHRQHEVAGDLKIARPKADAHARIILLSGAVSEATKQLRSNKASSKIPIPANTCVIKIPIFGAAQFQHRPCRLTGGSSNLFGLIPRASTWCHIMTTTIIEGISVRHTSRSPRR